MGRELRRELLQSNLESSNREHTADRHGWSSRTGEEEGVEKLLDNGMI